MDVQKNEARAYEAPKLRELGSVEELTRGSSAGPFTDDTFPIDTPSDEVTFSS